MKSCVWLLLVCGLAGCGSLPTHESLPDRYPQSVEEWEDDTVNWVYFATPFRLTPQTVVILEPLDTSKATPMFEEARGYVTEEFAAGIEQTAGVRVHVQVTGEAAPPTALRIRGTVLEIDTRDGLRMTRISGEVLDGTTGRKHLLFTHGRGGLAFTPGDSATIRQDIHKVGEDLGTLLHAHRGDR